MATEDFGAPAVLNPASRGRWGAGVSGGAERGRGRYAVSGSAAEIQAAFADAGFKRASGIAPPSTQGPGVSRGGKTSQVVQIEALVLIKILKHCTEYFPTPVNGLLLGLESSHQGAATLEVTDCFGLPNKRDLWSQLSREKIDAKEVEEKIIQEDRRYQVKMLEQLRLVNADCSTVGWYQTLSFDNMKDVSVIEGLCDHQNIIKDAIVIGFNPELAALGPAAFRAFRVTDEVLKCRREAEKLGPKAFAKLRGRDVLVEVPLVLRNSLLADSFAIDYLSNDRALQKAGEFDGLKVDDTADSLQKSLTFVSNCLDDVQNEQEKLMKALKDSLRDEQQNKELIERRRLENEQRRLRNEDLLPDIPPGASSKKTELPSQLPVLVMSSHVNVVSESIMGVVGDNLARTAVSRPDHCD